MPYEYTIHTHTHTRAYINHTCVILYAYGHIMATQVQVVGWWRRPFWVHSQRPEAAAPLVLILLYRMLYRIIHYSNILRQIS
jgi:hypothetical protein